MERGEAMHTGKTIEVEYRAKTADGYWKWLRSRGSPRFGPSGEILGWYGGTEDTDESKQLEEALRNCRRSSGEIAVAPSLHG
jgi:PAS domain S-box-containing protein